jgi:hypothetical protein
MKEYTRICIQRWRKNNPEKHKEQMKKSNEKSNAWLKIAREFRNILKNDTAHNPPPTRPKEIVF